MRGGRACSTRNWPRRSSTPGSRHPFIRLERAAPAPTLDYTVHFRAPLPEPGASAQDPYLATFRSGLARGDFFEEDGELWSQGGSLLAQSRQLALLLS